MEHQKYDHVFRETCLQFDLPFDKIKAFAIAISGLNPEFREKTTEEVWRVGVMGFPEHLATQYGSLPGQLTLPHRNIFAAVRLIKSYYDDLDSVIDDDVRIMSVFLLYLSGWGKQWTFTEDYYRYLEMIRGEMDPCVDIEN
jgi:hypothetical protein